MFKYRYDTNEYGDNCSYFDGYMLFMFTVTDSGVLNVDACTSSVPLLEEITNPASLTKLYSPGYVTNNVPQYTNNLDCHWQITAPTGYVSL